ncbi:hypothetical protein BX616_009667 [Lobosporangium transversale]|nr:hypothetical protein BX616_009667 [Lobosporangium transversale]
MAKSRQGPEPTAVGCPDNLMATETDIDNTNVSTHASPNVINKQAVKIMDMDKVSAAMGTYMLQGWAMLNDGCPDCNTPLMCNREATSQICVNCQLNPPVDSVEANQTQASPQSDGQILSQTASSISPSSPSPLPAVHTLSTPAPTTALPAPPSGPRSTSPQNHRVSALEPMAEARRPLRPVGNRNIGGSGPAPPSTPPPRSSTSLPAPPTTPPPSGVIKSALGSLSSKPNIPRPPGQPPSLPLSPPPASTHFTQPVPRDMRRSPQSSIILSGNILPPSTPLPALPGPSSTPPSFPSPPAQTSSSASTPETEMNSTAATAERQESANELSTDGEESIVKAEAIGPITNTSDVESSKVAAEFVQEYKPEISELHQNSTEGPTQGENQDQKQEHQQSSTSGDGGEDDKGAESDDDFEDAAEEVYKPTEEEIKERNLRREQSERASQLIGQKMLQGWAMLQDPCPNPSCHGVSFENIHPLRI